MYIVGIVGRVYYNKDNQKIIQTNDSVRRFLSKEEDIVCITILPPEDIDYTTITPGKDKISTKKLDHILNICDAFIVPGGTYSYNIDEYVIDYAIRNDKPLLAICLGFQALCNMFAKERTKFDMTNHLNNDNHYGPSNEYKHHIRIKENTLLSKILKKDPIPVNSVHHDIVDFKIDKLIINAISEDGIIEGVEYPDRKFIIGIQWHPEYLTDEYSNKIKEAFINAIKKG